MGFITDRYNQLIDKAKMAKQSLGNEMGEIGNTAKVVTQAGKELYQKSSIPGTLKYFPEEFGKNLVQTGKNIGQGIGKAVITSGSWPLDIASNIKGEEPMQPVDVPGIGEVKTMAREALDIATKHGFSKLGMAEGTVKALTDFVTGTASATSLYELAKHGLTSIINKPQTIEQISEKAGGWNPGDKVKFDTALHTGDAKTVRKMLPQVPKKYLIDFMSKIKDIVTQHPNLPPTSMPIEDQIGKLISGLGGAVTGVLGTKKAEASTIDDLMTDSRTTLTTLMNWWKEFKKNAKESLSDTAWRSISEKYPILDDIFEVLFEPSSGKRAEDIVLPKPKAPSPTPPRSKLPWYQRKYDPEVDGLYIKYLGTGKPPPEAVKNGWPPEKANPMMAPGEF